MFSYQNSTYLLKFGEGKYGHLVSIFSTGNSFPFLVKLTCKLNYMGIFGQQCRLNGKNVKFIESAKGVNTKSGSMFLPLMLVWFHSHPFDQSPSVTGMIL